MIGNRNGNENKLLPSRHSEDVEDSKQVQQYTKRSVFIVYTTLTFVVISNPTNPKPYISRYKDGGVTAALETLIQVYVYIVHRLLYKYTCTCFAPGSPITDVYGYMCTLAWKRQHQGGWKDIDVVSTLCCNIVSILQNKTYKSKTLMAYNLLLVGTPFQTEAEGSRGWLMGSEVW